MGEPGTMSPHTLRTPMDLAMDALAMGLNALSSVLIIFVNKILMDPVKGYGFAFATTMCAVHFLTSGGFVKVLEVLGYSEQKTMALSDALFFATISSASVASLNLSLMLNSVGFYQITKLMIIPAVAIIEFFWLGKRLTWQVMCAILVVVSGVAIVTVSDVAVNANGLMLAAFAVVAAAMQQVSCGHMQRSCGVTSNQLLSNSAPWLGLMLFTVGPWIDLTMSGLWVLDYKYTVVSASLFMLTCIIAVLVNVSQFVCLGRFHAVTFTVLGHSKTVMVLLIGWLCLGEEMTWRKFTGMSLAILGMVLFGWLQSSAMQPKQAQKSASRGELRSEDESKPLLSPTGGNGPADLEKGGK